MTRNTLCAFLFPALAAMAGCAPSDGDGDENPASGGAQTPAVDAGPPPPAEAMGLLSLSIEPTRPRLVVGQVKEFRAGELDGHASIIPAVDFTKLEDVFVVIGKTK